MVRDTSILAYKDILKNLPTKRKEVFRIIYEYGPITNTGIAKLLAWPINCVTGRTNELVASGVVVDSGKVKEANRLVHQWIAVM